MAKRSKHYLNKYEFIFNLISLITIIIIVLYFGIRSFYYYGVQNSPKKTETPELNEIIINNNKVVKNKDGLHRNNDGYYFKGRNVNNYVYVFNRIFRIISINDSGTIKLVSENNVASFMWGEDSSYKKSNLYTWLTKTDNEYSGVYYDTLPNPNKFIVKTNYSEDILSDKVKKGKNSYSDYVTSLGIADYINSGASKGFLNNNKIFYLIGNNKNKEKLYVNEDGEIETSDGLDGYGIRAVITLKKGIQITGGDGTSNSPYVIKQDKDTNYIDSYVKLGNDTWKIYNEENGLLKMYLYGYITNNGVQVLREYSNKNSLFNLNNKNNIAYYLNNTYLNSLSYNYYLVSNKFYIGEISDESGYIYKNIYNNVIECKVGLLNIFDYVSNNLFDDYFHLNNTSEISDIEYSTNSRGLVEEVDVTEKKHIVPVISINANIIKNGDGTINNPYVVE